MRPPLRPLRRVNVIYGNTLALESRLDGGLSPDSTVAMGYPWNMDVSLLDLAIQAGQRGVIRMLLAHGASVNPPDEVAADGTPLGPRRRGVRGQSLDGLPAVDPWSGRQPGIWLWRHDTRGIVARANQFSTQGRPSQFADRVRSENAGGALTARERPASLTDS